MRAGFVLCWLAIRGEHWRGSVDGTVPGLWRGGLAHAEPPSLVGVMGLLFAVGDAGARWFRLLKHTLWYPTLAPHPLDLRAHERSSGCWTGALEGVFQKGGSVEAFFDTMGLPHGLLATVALMGGASDGDVAATITLVGGLVRRCDALGRTLRVIVTVEGGVADRAEVGRRLRALGAFVVQMGCVLEASHFHLFPMRAVIVPRGGQIVGVDLADHLAIWRPGGSALLYRVPFEYNAVAAWLEDVATGEPFAGVVLNVHVDMNASEWTLESIDGVATLVRDRLLGADTAGGMLFTSRERLDGGTGTMDVLLINA